MNKTARENSKASNRDIAIDVARFLDGKRAESVSILDVQAMLPITSFFVLGTVTSSRALRSLGSEVEKVLKGHDLPRMTVELDDEGRWLCIDYGEVVVHLFDQDARAFYELDRMWADAPRIDFPRGEPSE